MPYALPSDYRAPRLMRNGHVQTIFASVCRIVRGVHFTRVRIDTRDGDFLDLDFSEVSNGPWAILVHGLEGSSEQNYMLGMTRSLNARGINVVCLNLRGCSGEMNKRLVSYDMGSTGDIDLVVDYMTRRFLGVSLYLIGFSLGGNLVLKFLGEKGDRVPPQIERAAVFSVPVDLKSTAPIISESTNRIYFHQFMYSVQCKLWEKNQVYPGHIHPKALEWSESFKQLDEYFTAPLLGFESAEHYWDGSSAKPWLHRIAVPTLLVNAKDDPLLSAECFPVDIAAQSVFLTLETPEHGGHVAFVTFNKEGEYWSEKRAVSFILHGK